MIGTLGKKQPKKVVDNYMDETRQLVQIQDIANQEKFTASAITAREVLAIPVSSTATTTKQ